MFNRISYLLASLLMIAAVSFSQSAIAKTHVVFDSESSVADPLDFITQCEQTGEQKGFIAGLSGNLLLPYSCPKEAGPAVLVDYTVLEGSSVVTAENQKKLENGTYEAAVETTHYASSTKVTATYRAPNGCSISPFFLPKHGVTHYKVTYILTPRSFYETYIQPWTEMPLAKAMGNHFTYCGQNVVIKRTVYFDGETELATSGAFDESTTPSECNSPQ